MNKFQFVRMLKDIVESNGIDWLKGQNPSVKEQYNAIVKRLRDKEGYHGVELTKRALNEFFNVDGAFENVDPRQFSTYMSSIKNGNNPQSMLFSLYTNSRDMDDIRSDFNNAKDVYPHEIMGYSEDEFYNPSNPNYWGGMDYYKNEDGTLDSTRGFLKKMVENNMETKEFIKLLQEEQRKRDLERIWDFQDKRNYDGLGSGDGIVDKAYRNLVDFSARNYWGNTVNDYKSGEALNDKDYGVFGGLNVFDVASNVADGVTGLATPFAPIGKVGTVIKGVGLANDIAQPIARETYESDKYGRDFDPTNIFKEEAIRLAPQAMSVVPKIPGKIGEYVNKVDDYTFGNQKTDDAWNVFGKKSNQAIKEQSSKPMYNPEGATMVDEWGNPVKNVESISDVREVRNPSNYDIFPTEEGMMVKNKLGSDLEEMESYLKMRKEGWELTPEDVARIRELAKQYPEFNAKYFGKDMTKGMKLANLGAKGLIDAGKKAVARKEPEALDISKLGTSNEDYNTISKAYNELDERKPDAVYSATHYSGGGKGLTEYEKAIVKKYLELNLYHGRNGLNVFN